MDKNKVALELRDIHLGEPDFWPLAPGWWVLIIIAIIALFFAIKILLKAQHQNRINKLMQRHLIDIREEYNAHKDKHKFASDVSLLLKRFVKSILKDKNAVALTDKQWINYLNNRAGTQMFDGLEEVLTKAQYQPNIDFDVSTLVARVKNFFPLAIKSMNKKETK